MSYELHIVRDAPISAAEWLALVRGQPGEWDLLDELSITNPATGERLVMAGRGDMPHTVWKGHPDRPRGVHFRWSGGRVHVPASSPFDPTFTKLHTLARALSARVEGDEGEVYHAGLRGHLQAIARFARLAQMYVRAARRR